MAALALSDVLVDRMLSPEATNAWLEKAPGMQSLTLGPRELLDLELLALGAFSRLEGYMVSSDYHSVVEFMRLDSGTPWTLPITLAVSHDQARSLPEGQTVVLSDSSGRPRGVLEIQDRYCYDRMD